MNTEYLTFCATLKKMVDSGKSLNERDEIIEIGALSTLGNIRAIRELIIQNRYSKTLEIGLAYGGSALTFLATLKEVSSDKFHHVAIDPFQQKRWDGGGLKVIGDENYLDNFTLYEDYSALVLPDLMRNDEKFDLIYIDGSHLFEDVFVDFFYVSRILKLGGIVLFDDCRDQHVLKVIKFIKTNYSQMMTELDYSKLDDPNKPLIKKIGNKLGVRQLCGFQKISEPPRTWDAHFSNF